MIREIQCPFLYKQPLGITGCEEIGDLLPNYGDGVPLKSSRCPIGETATHNCRVSQVGLQRYLDRISAPSQEPSITDFH